MPASPMSALSLAAVAAFCFGLTMLGTGLYRRYAIEKSILDIPNDRSSHAVPTPRGGGVVFVAVWAATLAVLAGMGIIEAEPVWLLLPPALLAAAVGFADDLFKLKAKTRFTFHLAAALLFLWNIGGYNGAWIGPWHIHAGFAGNIFAALWIVWSINLFNFMDGIDGIASVEAITVLGTGAAFLAGAGGGGYAAAALWAAASVGGFFFWNRPKAKIFMGDAGSYFLGFLIAAFALVGERRFNVPLLLWVIIYGAFWFDATLTLGRRAAAGERWYDAHRSHAYQRLVQSGWSHGQVVFAIALINGALAALAAAGYTFREMALALALAGLLPPALMYWLAERRQPMYLPPAKFPQ